MRFSCAKSIICPFTLHALAVDMLSLPQTDTSVAMSVGDVMASLTACQESGRLPALRDDTTVEDQVKALTWDSLGVRPAAGPITHLPVVFEALQWDLMPGMPVVSNKRYFLCMLCQLTTMRPTEGDDRASVAASCLLQCVAPGPAGPAGDTYMVNIDVIVHRLKVEQINRVLLDK